MPEFTSTRLSVDASRLGGACEEEWQLFLDDIDLKPIPHRQDYRGFFLNWVALFVPEAFPTALQSTMTDWLKRELDADDEVMVNVKVPLIGSTLYALTGSTDWLRIQLRDFAYGGSFVRTYLHQSLALAAPELYFYPDLASRLDFGMKCVYFDMDIPLALYVVARGDAEEKLNNFKRWQQGFMNAREQELVDGIVKGYNVRNPLESWIRDKMTYTALRLGCLPLHKSVNAGLPLGIEFSSIWERMQVHPLFHSYIELKRSELIKS